MAKAPVQTSAQDTLLAMMGDNIKINAVKDREWLHKAFLLANGRMEEEKERIRYKRMSTADMKYTGTGIGQNTTLNPPPAFTPLCDIPRPGLLADKPTNFRKPENLYFSGMGPRYSESLDDNKQVVHLRFGTVKYKGLITFFTSFYDTDSARLARYGRVGIGYYFGRIIGTIITFPLLFLHVFNLAGNAWRFLMGRQSTKFMDLKPAMPLFWQRVQVMYNSIGANLGVIPRFVDNTGHYGKGADELSDLAPTQFDEDYRSAMHRQLPRIFKPSGELDVFEVALGGARREQHHRRKVEQIAENAGTREELYSAIMKYMDEGGLEEPKPDLTFTDYLKGYLESILGNLADAWRETDAKEDEMSAAVQAVSDGSDPEALNKLKNLEQQRANQNGGTNAGTEMPAENGAVNDIAGTNSFMPTSSNGIPNTGTNTTGEVDANGNPIGAGMTPTDFSGIDGVNPAADKQRNTSEFMTTIRTKDVVDEAGGGSSTAVELVEGWFTRAKENFVLEANNGAAFLNLQVNHTGSGSASFSNSTKDTTLQGVFNSASGSARDTRVATADFNTGFGLVDAATKFMGNVFNGVMDSVQLSGLMALAGNAFVDISKQWDNSTATFPTATFTMELRSPYGSDLARYLNLYLPIATLLAGALPISTGPQSYTSPFVCECYSRGFTAIRFGIFDSLSITAATGNLGYNTDRQPLGFDVSFTIIDLSSVMHAPIGNGFNPTKPLRRVFDDDNAFNDYLANITGVHMRDMVDSRRKFALRAAARWMDYKTMFNPGYIAANMADTGMVRSFSKIFGNSSFPGV